MIEVRDLQIAGLRFVLEAEEGWRVVEDDPRYEPFLNQTDSGSDRLVSVRLSLDTPDLTGLPVLFDTGDAWRAFREGGDVVIDMAPDGGPGRLWTARLHEDRSRVSIFCGAPLVVNEDRQIRNPVRYPLDQILMLGLMPELGGLVVHGAGAVRGGVGLAFPGRSGAGKSTLMRLMREVKNALGLSDDRVVLRTAGASATIFGTPWSGDERVAANSRAPLGGLVFLHHSNENRLTRIDSREALRQLLPTACIPWYDEAGVGAGLTVCGALVGAVPAYELHFRPESSALSVLDALW